MKREIREVITMSDNGIVTVPNNVRMNIGEIANLFGIYYRTAKRYIRVIEKSGIVNGDYSMCCTVEGQKVYPEYYGLEMVIALAFHIQSPQAIVFRKYLVKIINTHSLIIQLTDKIQKIDNYLLN
ncbi:helix-turn-helix domain-containing protein [Dysgonomonas sp. BGC7]|uniref:helix-turn-helix domain-containing protein n=1 Tax=Dysgonomonas sp. BGC7 TaxID=1658008 RepID=UPI00068084A5|nr:helix-turn-helix domain-containing protein [Dysgonomonas sp. BGC7]MBD8390494.1 helix-turn-helix domain-containing protein [Dysgonomonas sp. BGC7]